MQYTDLNSKLSTYFFCIYLFKDLFILACERKRESMGWEGTEGKKRES